MRWQILLRPGGREEGRKGMREKNAGGGGMDGRRKVLIEEGREEGHSQLK